MRRASVLLVLLLSACAPSRYKSSGDALADLMNPDLNVRERAKSVGPAITQSRGTPGLERATLAALEKIAWNPLESPRLRSAAIKALFAEGGETAAKTRASARLALPREHSREVVVTICEAAADQHWSDLAPAILRSYARPVKGVEDAERTERQALESLFPGQDLARVAFDVFVADPAPPPDASADWSVAQRADAWDVANRFDPDGSKRRGWVLALTPTDRDAELATVALGLTQLHVLPRTSFELDWLLALRRDRPGERWWGEVATVVAGLPASPALELHHLQALRWASQNNPAWLSQSREELLAELSARLAPREHYERSADPQDRRPRDRLAQTQSRLSWADLVTVLAIERVVMTPQMAAALVPQAELDRKDATTEYGGAIETDNGPLRAVLHMPRGSERGGDSTFVASPEMIDLSRFALAHYHFHAQNWRNQVYAGPSPQDLDYARRYGRSCLVFTAVANRELAVDYYQPDGTVVDLGTISQP